MKPPEPPAGDWPDDLACVALGSNLGDSAELLTRALARLRPLAAGPLLCSSFYRTAPVECPPGSPDFLNAVVLFRIPGEETPQGLLAKLQALEREFGRLPKRVQNEARPLDLDLVAFGALQMNSEPLTLPHPRATQRRFVMEPLAQIAPDLRFPGNSLTAAEIVTRLG